jgi:hypothetical protein
MFLDSSVSYVHKRCCSSSSALSVWPLLQVDTAPAAEEDGQRSQAQNNGLFDDMSDDSGAESDIDIGSDAEGPFQ